jgi:hypothetical protein
LQAVTAWLGDVADIALPPDLHWQVLLLTLGIALAIWKIRGGHGSKNAEGRERKAGLFAYLFSGDITEATVLNIGFFFLLFGFSGSFRHYHVQFHYPHWLSKWLHSPAMHHIHHSYLPQHWDRNFAAVTSLWDRLFGTLYIPERDEYTPWGLGPESQDDYRSFWQNTRAPFRDWYRMLRPEPGVATLTMRRDKPL